MFRAMIGAVVGTCILAVYGLWQGFTEGCGWRQPVLPPGFEAAAVNALSLLVYLGWAPLLVGGVIGGIAGLGSWFVGPRGGAARA